MTAVDVREQGGRHLLGHRSRIVVLIPAHNEAAQIGHTLAALRSQTTPPDDVVVVCDNCTDRTPEIAAAASATVFVTRENTHRKAGALNQALREILPLLADEDVVLVQDADSALDDHFIEYALEYVDEGYGGVGGVFRGSPGGGFVGHLQRNEYARYARDIERLRGRSLVLTGTAAAFPVGVLKSVSQARVAGRLPAGDGAGGVYDTTVLTEDNELTFALLHLGRRVISPPECGLRTEVMTSWGDLWRQRLRWKRGAVENCVQYGLTRVTWRYWGRQVWTFLGVLVSLLYLSSLLILPFLQGFAVQPFWLLFSLVFVLERVVTVRHRGWRYMALAATMYESLFEYFLQACHAKAYFDALFRKARNW